MDLVVTKRVACSWDEGLAALEQFKARKGHCNVPRDKVEGAVKLGRWARAQRTNQDRLSANRRRRLGAIGFIWNLRDRAWEEGYSRLKNFRMREGHGCVPQHHIEGTFRLGQWVNSQRKRQKKLHTERKRRLDSLGFVWNPRQARWEEMFARLRESNHYRLSEERWDRLNRLGFVWTPFHEAWQRGFFVLRKFKSREGHCRVPEARVEGTYNLGAWAKEQRRKKNSMAVSRRQQLDAIGFWQQSIGVAMDISQRHQPEQLRAGISE